MKNMLLESELPKNQVFFHGSAKNLMKKFDEPSFAHPFYMTTDVDYALAFSTKRHSSTGHEKEGVKIEFQQSGNDTYVYAISLKEDGKFLDMRDTESQEFKELIGLLPQGIQKLIDVRMEQFSHINGGKKTMSQYSGMKNDVWFLFDHIKNTVIGLNTSNPRNQNFNKSKFLEIIHKSPQYYILSGFEKDVENKLKRKYSEYYYKYSEEQREQIGKELYGDEELIKVYNNGSFSIMNGSKLSSNIQNLAELLFKGQDGEKTEELYDIIIKSIRMIFVQFVTKKKELGFSTKYSYSNVLYQIASHAGSLYDKLNREKIFNEISDKDKNNLETRSRMMRDYTYRNGDLTNNVDFRETEFGSFQNMIDIVTRDVEGDEYLNGIPEDITTHQLMSHYFEILSKRGYCGVISSEDDTDEEDNKTVITNCSVGVWDKAGLDKSSSVPMKYKWLRKVVQSAKNDNLPPDQKIYRYVSLYRKMSGERT